MPAKASDEEKPDKDSDQARSSDPRESRSARAGLQFSVGRVHKELKKGNFSKRIGAGTPIYLAGKCVCLPSHSNIE